MNDDGWTPVKVRGKKRHRRDVEGDDRSRSSSSTRPQEKKREQKGKKILKMKREAGRSQLERLPAEIVEEILLYSANVNLPLASPYLASKVSSPHMYMALCGRVFAAGADGDSSGDGVTSSDQHEEHAKKCAKTQSAILAQPWMTYTFYQSLQTRHLLPSSFAPGTRIPLRLLCPSPQPFESGPLALLEALLDRGASVDWTNSVASEVGQDGLRMAVLQGCEPAVRCLVGRLGIVVTTELLRVAVIERGVQDWGIIRVLGGLEPALWVENQASDPPNVETADGPNLLDPELWRWAEQNRAEDETRGEGSSGGSRGLLLQRTLSEGLRARRIRQA